MAEVNQQNPAQQMQFLENMEAEGFISPDEQSQLDQFRQNPPDLSILANDSNPPIDQQGQFGQLQDQSGLLESLNPAPEPVETEDGRSFVSIGTETGLEITGSIVGGIIGSRVQRPVQGAAAGSAAGQSLFQSLQRVAPGVFGEAPETSGEAIGKIGTAGASDLLFGGVATALKPQIGKFNPLNKLSDEDLRTLEFLEKNVGTENIPLSLIAPESKSIALGENLAAGSLLSSGTFKQQRKNIQQIIQDGLQHQANVITKGASREQISKNILSVIKSKTKAQTKALDDVAVRIQQIMKERGSAFSVDISNALKILNKEFTGIPAGLRANKELKIFSNFIDNAKITKFGDNKLIPFRQSQSIVNDLTEDIVKLSSKKGASIFGLDNASRLKNKLIKLRSSLVKSQAGSIKGIGDPELSKAFGTMQQIMLQGHDKFNERLITNMMKSDDLAATIITNTIKSPREMRRLKFLLGPEWRRVEGLQYQDLIRKHTSRAGGKKSLNADSLLDTIDKMDPGMKKVMFNHKTMNKFTEFAEVLAKTQGDKATNIGTVFIELAQAGAFTSMLFGGPTGAATTIMFGPAAFEKLFTNPKIIGKLIKAAKQGQSKELSTPATIVSSILSDLTKAGVDYTISDSPRIRAEDRQENLIDQLVPAAGNADDSISEDDLKNESRKDRQLRKFQKFISDPNFVD